MKKRSENSAMNAGERSIGKRGGIYSSMYYEYRRERGSSTWMRLGKRGDAEHCRWMALTILFCTSPSASAAQVVLPKS